MSAVRLLLTLLSNVAILTIAYAATLEQLQFILLNHYYSHKYEYNFKIITT